MNATKTCQFGPFVLDAGRRLLWRDDVLITLTPKTIEVLCVLLDRRGQVVEKAELMEAVWPKTIVEDNNLARHVSTLRKALGERKGTHDYIYTVPGHGYMFVSPVVEIERTAEAATAVETHHDSPAIESTPEHPPVIVASHAPPRPWIIGLTVGASIAVALTVIAWPSMRRGPSTDRARSLQQLTFDGGVQRDPAWSPDGRSIVYAADKAGNLDLYVRTIDDPTPVQLTVTAFDEAEPDWSPDGQSLVFRSEIDGGGIFVMPATGGDARQVSPFGYRPQWSSDGSRILFRDGTAGIGMRAFVVNARTPGPPVAVRPDFIPRLRRASVAWHPDGARVSIAGSGRDGRWTFITSSLDGATSIESSVPRDVLDAVKSDRSRLGEFVWSPSRDRIFFEGSDGDTHTIWSVSVDPVSLSWMSGLQRVSFGPGQYSDLAVAGDGARLAFTVRNEQTRVWRFPFDPIAGTLTGPGTALARGGPPEYDVSAPADGSKVAFRTTRGGHQEVWERSVRDGTERLLVSSTDRTRTTPRWSRDGTRLAYLRTDASGMNAVSRAVAILPVAGGSEQLLSLPREMDIVPDDWSADGTWILAACQPAPRQPRGTCLIRTTDTHETADVRMLAFDPSRSQMCQRFSPDERWISFIAVDIRDPNVSTIYVMPAAGGPWIPVTDGRFYDDKPRWSPDGRTIYFFSKRTGAANVWGRRFDPHLGRAIGEPFQVTTLKGSQQTLPRLLGRAELAISRDSLFVPVTETSATIWMLDRVTR